MNRIICVALLLFVFVTPLAQAANIAPMKTFKNRIILKEDAPDAAKKTYNALVKAAQQEKWDIVGDDGNTLRLKRIVRKRHTVVIDVHIRGKAVDVDYVSSENMHYQKNVQDTRGVCGGERIPGLTARCADGEVINPNYGAWVSRLLKIASRASN
ncbi:MAG: hypothetical protein LBF61_01380 [Azoarcus sp.]|jgi:hypothetical protein|nr:hypothetical protein [Azoarcus sp.]